MQSVRSTMLLVAVLLFVSLHQPARSSASSGWSPLAGDALQPPRPSPATTAATSASPSRYQPSAFLAGRVAVQVLFVESNGSQEPSTRNWDGAQVAEITSQITTALQWWSARLPNARLSFDVVSQVVPSGYEPITHGLNTESQWIGDTLNRLGNTAPNYFDQAYTAADKLRHDRQADWATTIFVANSAGTSDGRFADGLFAYAYVNGPFMVVTSNAGPYGAQKLAPVVAHEFGHIFGALDQYASAATPCTQQSGYLAIASTNSQANNCGTRFGSIMLEPLNAYLASQIDASALGQVGYRDANTNTIPDPLDTTPAVQLQLNQPSSGRPIVSGQAIDQPFPSPSGESVTINTIKRIEYRADGDDWYQLPPQDGAYDSAGEAVNSALPLYDGSHLIQLRATNSIGAVSAIAQYNLSVSGVGGNPNYQVSAPKLSNSSTININLVAPNGSAAQISEDASFHDTSWAPVQPSMPWSFGPADGARTLYIRLRDQSGLESPVFARTVIIDRTPPTGRAALHSKPTSWLEIVASDTTTQISSMQININSEATANWQPFQATVPLTLQANSITIRLRDEAGNISAPIDAQAVTPIWLPLIHQ